jgi:hypothetical protein
MSWRKISSEKALNTFFLVPFIGILSSVNTLLTNVFNVFDYQLAGLIERLLVMLGLFYWIYFFSCLGIKIANKKIHEILIVFIASLTFIFVSLNLIDNKFHHYTISFFYSIEITFCFIYLKNVFVNPPKQILKKNPIFLIVTGLLIRCVVAIPIHLASEIMFVGKHLDEYSFIFPLTNIAIIIMHFHFIYAFMCIKNFDLERGHSRNKMQEMI